MGQKKEITMYYTAIYSDEYLAHHGVLGMKWGVWNEETRARYMGGKGNDSKKKEDISEKEKFHLTDGQKKAIKIGAAIAVGLLAAGVTYAVIKNQKDKSSGDISGLNTVNLNTANLNTANLNTANLNTVKLNTVGGGSSLAESDLWSEMSDEDRRQIAEFDNLGDYPNLERIEVTGNDLKVAQENGFETLDYSDYEESLYYANPFYDDSLYTDPTIDVEKLSDKEITLLYGSTMNCGNSMIAEECRRRGLDVMAHPNAGGMAGAENLGEYFTFKDGSDYKIDTSKLIDPPTINTVDDLDDYRRQQIHYAAEVYKTIASQLQNKFPEGSRGFIGVPITDGFNGSTGHYMSWEIFQGKTIIKNPQNESMDMIDLMSQLRPNAKNGFATYGDSMMAIRADNADINSATISEVVGSYTNKTDEWVNRRSRTFIEVQTGNGFVDALDYAKGKSYDDFDEDAAGRVINRGENFITSRYIAVNDNDAKVESKIQSAIRLYKEEHPNTTLSDERIRWDLGYGA
jgi:hypothetical protein